MKVGDLDIGRIGLGTNRLEHSSQNVAFIKDAVAAGLQMIDTAHLYTGGHSEETIGEALGGAGAGGVVVVATKGGFRGARPDTLHAEIEQSFRSLRTDVIALYYLHRVDPETPIEESLGVIKGYRDKGQIQNVGISQVDVEQIERARKVVPIAAVQNHYNLAERKYDAVVDYCDGEGIVFVPFYPLRDGHSKAVDSIARRHNATPQQVMLAWLLHRTPAMLPIPGTLSLEHLKENLAAQKIELTKAEYEELT